MIKKIYFCVEGETETYLVNNLIRKEYWEKCELVNDLIDFVQKDDGSKCLCYCEDSRSINRIPHLINENLHLLVKAKLSALLIIGDVERLKCYVNRKKEIEKYLKAGVDLSALKYSFFNKTIEEHYWDCPESIEAVLKKEYGIKFNSQLGGSIDFDAYPKDITGLKRLFQANKVKYRESRFAENFFGRMDFSSCQNLVLSRIKSHINEVLNS